jgi:hypothetical protein
VEGENRNDITLSVVTTYAPENYIKAYRISQISQAMQALALKEIFDILTTSILDIELVRREQFQVRFPAKQFGKQVSLVHSFQSAVAEGKRYVLKRSTAGQLLCLMRSHFFSREVCILHDCWVYELLSFDLILCKNQLIRAKMSSQCSHMIGEQYYHM